MCSIPMGTHTTVLITMTTVASMRRDATILNVQLNILSVGRGVTLRSSNIASRNSKDDRHAAAHRSWLGSVRSIEAFRPARHAPRTILQQHVQLIVVL